MRRSHPRTSPFASSFRRATYVPPWFRRMSPSDSSAARPINSSPNPGPSASTRSRAVRAPISTAHRIFFQNNKINRRRLDLSRKPPVPSLLALARRPRMTIETQHGLDLRLDPWEVEYGSELPLTGGAAARDDVDLGIEQPAAEWAPIRPRSGVRLPRRLCFVDGVRRVEARVVARRHGRVTHGAFGSYGVGAVLCEGGGAHIEDERVERVLALDSGESLPGAFLVGPGLAYRPVSTPSTDPGAPLQRIQDEMRLAEERLAREREIGRAHV